MAAPVSGNILADAATFGAAAAIRKPTKTIVFERATAGLCAWKADADCHVVYIAPCNTAAWCISRDPTITQSSLSSLDQTDLRLMATGLGVGINIPIYEPIKKDDSIYYNAAATGRCVVLVEYD
jgi:hypothetical protein